LIVNYLTNYLITSFIINTGFHTENTADDFLPIKIRSSPTSFNI